MDFKKVIRLVLSNKKMPMNHKINFIKENVNSTDYSQALKMHPAFLKYIHQKSRIENIENINLKDPFYFSADYRKEFKWAINTLEPYFKIINEFLLYKNLFEKLFITQKYNDAVDVITTVEEKFGISLWSLESRLLITEFVEGTEKNWEILSEFLKDINNPFYDFIISSNSKRLERGLAYDSYITQFQNDIDNVNSPEVIKDILVFKCFNIANFDYQFKSLESVYYFSNIFTPIDQYSIIIDAIIYNVSTDVTHDKLILAFVKQAKDIIVNDHRLNNLYNIINASGEFIENNENTNLVACANAYYEGKFQESCMLSKNNIIRNPLEFEYYEIYCKSLINLQTEFVSVEVGDVVDDILSSLYKTFTFEKQFEHERKNLLKWSLLFMNFDFGKQLYSLLSEIEIKQNRNFSTSVLSSTASTPKNLLLDKRQELINRNFENKSGEHAYKVFKYKAGEDLVFETKLSESEAQAVSVQAIHLYNKHEYTSLISLLNNTQCLDGQKYYYERKVGLLLTSYLKLNLIEEALHLFGNIMFDDSFTTSKLNYNDIVERINVNDITRYYSFIELPILYSLTKKEYDLYEVYDEFMVANEFENIFDIDINRFISLFTLSKTIYFFNKVLTINTIKYSTDYASISEVEEERVYILGALIEMDSKNKLVYQKEIDDIYRINSVRKVLEEVDEGRLYIDVKNLKDLQIKSFNDVFKRFKDIQLLSTGKSLIAFNASTALNWDIELQDKTDAKEEYSSADYLAFKNMYLISRDNFLFSKEYGLDSCLSTRIRHGALKNHIRSVFEKLDLITSKHNNVYVDNHTWEYQLKFYPDVNAVIQDKLKSFSRKIDDYTNYIVESLIQIRTEKNTEKSQGLFVYFTNDDILYNYYIQNKSMFDSIDSTIETLLTNLVNYTLFDIQQSIIEAFTVVIPKFYQDIIGNLIDELREIDLINGLDLITNLSISSTNIQSELEYLSKWFYLNTTSSSSLLNLETILNASVELTNKINPTYNLLPSIDIKTEVYGYSSLIFVFNIMLNNVIAHSKLSSDKINLVVKSDMDEDEKYVHIIFTHNVDPNFDYSVSKSKLEHVRENWNDHSNIERSNKEGESGYDKIKRILIYEALAKTEKFDFSISDNNLSISLFFPYAKPLSHE